MSKSTRIVVTIIVVILTTCFESAGLIAWLRLVLAGENGLGYMCLLAGELLELTIFVAYLQATTTGPKTRSPVKVIGAVGLIALFESLLWVFALAVYHIFGPVQGLIVLAILMHLKHDADVAVLSDTPLFHQVLTSKGLLATGLEVTGAILFFTLTLNGWWLIGGFAFLLCNALEHLVGGMIVSEALGGRGYLTASRRPRDLTVVVPIAADSVERLRGLLETIGGNIERNTILRFRQSESTHFARFVILDHDSTRAPSLLFSSNHDNSLVNYAQELSLTVADGLDRVFSHSCAYVPRTAHHGLALAAFLRRHSLRSKAFFSAYHDSSVQEILRCTAKRQDLEKKLDDNDAKTVRDLSALSTGPAKIASPLPAGIRAAFGRFLGWVLEHMAGIRVTTPTRDRRMTVTEQLIQAEDHKVQNQITVISKIKPGLWPRIFIRLAFYLISVQAARSRGSLSGLTTIHFARWVIIDEGEALYFESNYDGSWENYIDDFVDFASTGMNVIWGTAVDFPSAGCRDIEAFKHIIRNYQRPTQVFFSAYPEQTVINNLNDLAIEESRQTLTASASVRRLLTGSFAK